MFHLFGYTICGAKKHNHKNPMFLCQRNATGPCCVRLRKAFEAFIGSESTHQVLLQRNGNKCCLGVTAMLDNPFGMSKWTGASKKPFLARASRQKRPSEKRNQSLRFCMIQRALWLPCIPHLPAQGDCNSRTSKCCGVPYTKHDFCDTKKIMAVCMYKFVESFASVCSVIFVL